MFDKERTILIASDHGGYAMKKFLIENLSKDNYKFEDLGTYSEDSVDYSDYIHPLASRINKNKDDLAIIICGSGNGAQMTANKYENVRAGLCWNQEQAKLTRLHNNANILSLPGRFIDFDEAVEIAKVFLNTDFEGGRHEKRVKKIAKKPN